MTHDNRHLAIHVLTGIAVLAIVAGFVAIALNRETTARTSAAAQGSQPPSVLSAKPHEVPIPGSGGKVARIAPGHEVEIVVTGDASQDGGRRDRVDQGEASGIGVDQRGTNEKGSLKTDAPGIGMGKGFFADAGDTDLSWSSIASGGPGLIILIGVALGVLGALAWFWGKMAGLGIALIIAGGLTIAVGVVYETHPEYFLLVLALPLVLGLYVVLHAWRARQATLAANTAARGIEDGATLEPKDLKDLPADMSHADAQKAINSTLAALKEKLMKRSEASGGVLKTWLTKLGV